MLKKIVFTSTLFLSAYVQAYSVQPMGVAYEIGPYTTYVYEGDISEHQIEMRHYADNGYAGRYLDLQVFSDTFDLALYLFDIPPATWQLSPYTSAGYATELSPFLENWEGASASYSMGGDQYLGDFIAYDETSGAVTSTGSYNPRITGYVDSPYISAFVVPVGTTEQMIRTNDLDGMADLIWGQIDEMGITAQQGLNALLSEDDFLLSYTFSTYVHCGAVECFGAPEPTLNELAENAHLGYNVSEPSVAAMFALAAFGFAARRFKK
ncbi:MAG TPA: hypothetical protein DHW71_05170 [Gammaproteobacteria bacterium]|nr:hypothetical protein [Gammaproteobacteria bacterium]HCK92353.1 hypothetical protein [Gammaproteobacteria bacterium]|tara:strand:+ start:685 stop:1482 length:798 start_codon:yes stop_codon:yes gene_type:complete